MPLPVISIAQMRQWEKATWATGQTEAEVIRRVGKLVAQYALRLTHPGDLILILAGNGNNGEDARSARDHLGERRIHLLEVKDPAADLSKLGAGLSLGPVLVIDGLFGIGLNRPLSEDWVLFIDCVNAARVPVLAVDVPSGLNADSGVPYGAVMEAAITLTIGAPKVGLLLPPAAPFVGRLEVAAQVGLIPCPIQSEVQWTTEEDFLRYPPGRAVGSHKGTYGHLAILAGSLGYHGAAVLAARAAQRAQPGLITLYPQEEVYGPVASQLQAVMVSPWQVETKLPGSATAVLAGPGLAAEELPDTLKTAVRHLWRDAAMPVVVDASALDWLQQDLVVKNALRVITPHPGEAARMLRCPVQQVQTNRFAAVRELSNRFGNAWVVLKGHQTLIGRNTGEIYINNSGNPYLAQGGSGDVLAGLVAGLLAQPGLQSDPLTALRYAAWKHGAAADQLVSSRKNWVVEDLLQEL